ncbi:MAG: dihydrofolate reductase family protein [Chloroflexota bacterium]|nr:dihydrofolate reductase family protein [Chloroflexota bacterium]
MGKVIFGLTMSLDGYINDRNGSVERLYSDLAVGNLQDESIQNNAVMQEAMRSTGAVVLGKHAFLMAEDPDSYADTYEFQVPIFVLSRTKPEKNPKENENLTFTFVTEGIEAAISQAKEAAGGKDVTIIGGASTAQQALRAGVVDELHIDIMPVLLCGGLRLFEALGTEQIRLERMQVVELPAGRTHLRFRIVQ